MPPTQVIARYNNQHPEMTHRALRRPYQPPNSLPELHFEDPGYDFQLEIRIDRREDIDAVLGTERLEYLKERATSNIQCLSHTGKKKAEVRE
jgi:hypothetical protein